MTYSQYAYVEAFLDMKQKSWINAHVHMYEYFGGVARILVPDNCKTAVVHNGGFKDQQINETYQEMAEHYGTAIIPARVRSPKDKPNAEGTVGNISTWITAALRNEQFFSLAELNRAIRDKLELFNQRLFQKKEGSRRSLFLGEEKPLLAPLPATRFELSDWKTATVQFNYHISVDGMLYSVPYEYIKKKVDVKVTDTTIEIFYNHNRIASHRRLKGCSGQYSTITEHMPEDHQKYLEWNGDRFRKWAERIGINTYTAVNAILTSKGVEQQTYRSCMGLLKLAERYSDALLEAACKKALSYTVITIRLRTFWKISGDVNATVVKPHLSMGNEPEVVFFLLIECFVPFSKFSQSISKTCIRLKSKVGFERSGISICNRYIAWLHSN